MHHKGRGMGGRLAMEATRFKERRRRGRLGKGCNEGENESGRTTKSQRQNIGFLQRWSAFCIIVTFVGFESAGAEFVAPFSVSKADDNVRLANLVSRTGAHVTCEFTYVTKEDRKRDQANNGQTNRQQQRLRNIRTDPSTLLSKLTGVCTRKTSDYWKYELCFESKVTQTHGRDSNSLGVYVTMDGNAQVYADGTPCEALEDKSGRMTRVEFVCDKSLKLLSVEEVSTCSYKFIVSTPVVCGHPEFPQASAVIGANEEIAPEQAWILELSEMDGGQFACSVSRANPVIGSQEEEDSDLTFERFELSLSSTSAQLFPQHHVCRRGGRIPLSQRDKHYSLQHTDSNARVTLRDGQNFQGNLEYVLIQAVPRDLYN